MIYNIELVHISGGSFIMGDLSGTGSSNEKPLHEVLVSDFNIGKYPVTQKQWLQVMESNPCRFVDSDTNCPVENVNWYDIQEFIIKLSERTGARYRLPTEAEWEYAARSGGRNELYSGSDNPDAVAWYDLNSSGKTHPVGLKQPNGLGIFDMSGNVWEWVQDLYWPDYYAISPTENPKGPESSDYRAIRGGSWFNYEWDARTYKRSCSEPCFRHSNLGFRLAMD